MHDFVPAFRLGQSGAVSPECMGHPGKHVYIRRDT
jgi:hypothetical protein